MTYLRPAQTVFLEPLEVVELGNKWRELLADELREIARILRHLSEMIGARAGEIASAIAAMAAIDLLVAKARLGEAMKAKYLPYDGPDQPWILEAPASLYLHDGRHPLLTGDVVPVSVWLGEQPPSAGLPLPDHEPKEFRILLITGPNTGGKTVALKTTGLLSLMAQAGLPVPAGEDITPSRLRRRLRGHRRRAEHRAVALDVQLTHRQHHHDPRGRYGPLARPP